MKKFKEYYDDNLKLNEVMYVFFDESGTYKNSEINKSIKEYRKKGIVSGGRDNFNISAVAISRAKYMSLRNEINTTKEHSCFDHTKYKHRTDYSFRNFTDREEVAYIECMDYFTNISKLMKKYKLPTYSIGYNFKTFEEADYSDIYIKSLRKLISEMKYNIANDHIFKKHKKIYFIFEKMADRKIQEQIEQLASNDSQEKFSYLWTEKGNVGNELSDLIAYNNSRYYANDLFLHTSFSFYNYPNHITKSIKINKNIVQ
ncbi:MAG: hypothetical protein ACK5NF_07295 [Bacilli bacterium]